MRARCGVYSEPLYRIAPDGRIHPPLCRASLQFSGPPSPFRSSRGNGRFKIQTVIGNSSVGSLRNSDRNSPHYEAARVGREDPPPLTSAGVATLCRQLKSDRVGVDRYRRSAPFDFFSRRVSRLAPHHAFRPQWRGRARLLPPEASGPRLGSQNVTGTHPQRETKIMV